MTDQSAKGARHKLSRGLLLLGLAASLTMVACDLPRPQPTSRKGFDAFVRPVTHPVYFESPIIEDEGRIYALYHELGDGGAPVDGGNARVYGVQARFVLDERTAFVINKLNFIDFNPDNGGDEEGFSDLGIGIKYALTTLPRENFILTAGVGYEFDQGTKDVLQGNGKGLWNPYLAAAKSFGNYHVIANAGAMLPLSTSRQSTQLHYHLHVDTLAMGTIRPFIEVNGYFVYNDGSKLDLEFEGADIFNFAARRSDDYHFLSGAAGFRYRIGNGDLGVAVEFPFLDADDFMEWRATVDYSLSLGGE